MDEDPAIHREDPSRGPMAHIDLRTSVSFETGVKGVGVPADDRASTKKAQPSLDRMEDIRAALSH
jgi:hypothetical protein